jgi:hypothetical protein
MVLGGGNGCLAGFLGYCEFGCGREPIRGMVD